MKWLITLFFLVSFSAHAVEWTVESAEGDVFSPNMYSVEVEFDGNKLVLVSDNVAVDNIALQAKYTLAVADISHGFDVENITLSSGATLTVADIHHAVAVDSVALTQSHILSTNDVLHGFNIDNIFIGTPSVGEINSRYSINIEDLRIEVIAKDERTQTRI